MILQSPVLPVMEGDDVTLTCRTKMADPPSADFYKDGVSIRNESDGHMTLHHVSRSDEGLYKCRVQNRESPESRLSVSGEELSFGFRTHSFRCSPDQVGFSLQENLPTSSPMTSTMDPPTASSPPPASSLHLVFRVICHLVVFCPYCISTFLMVSIYRERATGSDPPTHAEQGLDDDYDDVMSASPVLPVMEGDDVTLTCRTKMADPPSADFYKDGVSIRNESDGHMTLHHVNRSDEGLYKCRVQNRESPESRLSVSGKPTTTMDAPTALPLHLHSDSTSTSTCLLPHLVFRLICHLVVFCPYCISTFLMMLSLSLCSGGSVILQSPVLPVMEGDDVTLTCRTKMADPPSADFYKDGVSIRNESDGHMTLLYVSRSDEGLYKCRVQGNESAESRLSVSEKPTTTMDPPTASSPPPAFPHLVFRVICHLVVFCPYCISTFLMALLSVVVLSWTFVIYASRVAADWLLEERTALLQQH
ncbi:hypothetical protein F7725_016233 [Dissostichus mawsoni]|uniref:Ig-like domain-containing protein n=1 Tax=Dissostichus mawsoni TaxID=36200 RepID=A0A7J5Z1F6_DISMA|nr:hypothetical protein F7725_016233 [Dissostichus mawsoni]